MTNDGENQVDHARVARAVVDRHRLRHPAHVASGTEFHVYRAWSDTMKDVAIRIPRRKVFVSPNVNVDSRRLLEQENEITGWLADQGFPVAEPFALVDVEPGLSVLLARFVENDESEAPAEALGEMLRALHGIALPARFRAVYQGDVDLGAVVVTRTKDRYDKVRAAEPGLPDLTRRDLLRLLEDEGQGRSSLLHMDVRPPNLLTSAGRIRALVDWSNVLIGPPVCELVRMDEYSRMGNSPIRMDALLTGYGSTAPDLTSASALVYRLDAAVMLYLVFQAVAPDPIMNHRWGLRVRELAGRIGEVQARA